MVPFRHVESNFLAILPQQKPPRFTLKRGGFYFQSIQSRMMRPAPSRRQFSRPVPVQTSQSSDSSRLAPRLKPSVKPGPNAIPASESGTDHSAVHEFCATCAANLTDFNNLSV